MTVCKLTDGLRLTEAGTMVTEDSDSKQQRAATDRQGFVWLGCLLRGDSEREGIPLSRQNSVLHIFKSSSGTRALPHVLLTTEKLSR